MTSLTASQIRPDLLAKYDGRAPRYTSYPTAVQFTPEVGPDAYGEWLAALPADRPVSLYLHIPFCKRLCWYCGCNTRAVNRREPIEAYVRLLLEEIAHVARRLPARLPVETVHLGGGTPNMLRPADLEVLFGALRDAFEFRAESEVAAELDPAVLTADWVRAAAAHGLTRASLGVQNLDPAVQAAVNRPERLEEIAACVGWLREAGVASINLDLMYGLPGQTVANTLSTLDALITLRPDRLALFGYAHVPWMKAHQQLIDEAALPGPAERLAQSEAAAERLAAAGYQRIGLDHFALAADPLAVAAREGRLRRNFQGYTTDTAPTLIGFGASAIGVLPQGYVQNAAVETAWRKAVQAGGLAVARGVRLTPEARFRAEIIERLMCDLEVDLDAVCARHGRRLADLEAELASLAPMIADGLVEERPTLRMTTAGRFLVRSACAAFDAYMAPDALRHSKAI